MLVVRLLVVQDRCDEASALLKTPTDILRYLWYEKTGYVIDTHTGIGNAVYRRYAEETGDRTKTVIASTASSITRSSRWASGE